MCGDPNCKYISLIEDESGNKTAYHYGLNNDDYYILWVDYWGEPNSKVQQWRPVNRTKKRFKKRSKTLKILKNRVIKLGF